MNRLAVWGAVLVAAALLAFWLQGTIQDLCIVPAVELLRMGGLLLRSVPHPVLWSLLVTSVALISLGSLARTGRLPLRRRAKKEQAAVAGPIGKLAQHFRNAGRGPYFRWLIAHRLAELEQVITASPMAGNSAGAVYLTQRSTSPTEEPRGVGIARSGDPMAIDIQTYMEAGLDRPPISRPRRRFFGRRPPTPLDLEPSRVVEYLESQMETKA